MNMRTFTLQKITWLMAITTVVAVSVGYAAIAASNRLRPPTVVVTFNIEKVTTDLTERADAEVQLRDFIMKIEVESKAKFQAIEELSTAMESVSDTDRNTMKESLDQLKLSALSHQRFSMSQIDIERSLMFRDLYKKIKEAVEIVAQENGYDLVLINDDAREIVVNPKAQVNREFQVRNQIEEKRIVFSSEQIDITEQIVTHMNLEWEKLSN
jgi:Skp family chaperone for outer membrane proteins